MRGAALGVALAISWVGCSRHSSSTADSAAGTVAGQPPLRPARLSAVDGDVSLQTPGATAWTRPTTNYPISNGDRLATGSSGRAELDLGNAAVRLDNGVDATITEPSNRYTRFGLDQGALDASLYQYDPASSIEIDTPNGSLIPTEAGVYDVSVDPSGNSTLVNVVRGVLELAASGVNQTLNAGQYVRLVGSDPVQLVPVTQTADAFAPLDRWRTERDGRWTRRDHVDEYVSETVPGWEDLDDYGTWATDATNTPVWCPTRATTEYVPYRQGHWAWIEPWGWTWIDDQPWGYTTSHYGRWEQIASNTCGGRSHWAWVPTTTASEPVYAPALVAFVDASQFATSNAVQPQAWFPLGPREAYIPPYAHDDNYLRLLNETNLREVHDVRPLLDAKGPPHGRWANQLSALTVVPAAAFRGGEPVMRHMMHAEPGRVASAPIRWRPNIRPDARFIGGARPVPPPRVPANPRALYTRDNGHGNPHVEARGGQAAGEVAPAAPAAAPTRTPAPARGGSPDKRGGGRGRGGGGGGRGGGRGHGKP